MSVNLELNTILKILWEQRDFTQKELDKCTRDNMEFYRCYLRGRMSAFQDLLEILEPARTFKKGGE